jgi:hypothetical protein
MEGSPVANITAVQPGQLIACQKCCNHGVNLVKSSKELLTMPGEIKSADVMKALKSMGYIKNALWLLPRNFI